MIKNNNFETVRKRLKLTNRDFSKLIGIGETAYSKLKKGALPVGEQTIIKIKDALPEYNIEWLLYGKEPMYSNSKKLAKELNESIEIEENNLQKPNYRLEAKPIRLADPYGFEATGEKIYELPDHSLIMQVPVIPYKAFASYLRGHSDPEFYEGLETMPVPVESAHKGSYLIFEIGGESMLNPGSRRCIWPGEKIIGRDLRRDNWKYKLHINSTDCWVIVHRSEGVIVKEIIDHNIDTADITVHSWNPDKIEHPDYIISLNDVEQIFNVVDPFNKFG